jgi:hypothetical protein
VKPKRPLEQEPGLPVLFGQPHRDGIGFEQLGDLLQHIGREEGDIKFIDQRARNLVQRGLLLEREAFGQFHFAGVTRLKGFLVFLNALNVQIGFGGGKSHQQQRSAA